MCTLNYLWQLAWINCCSGEGGEKTIPGTLLLLAPCGIEEHPQLTCCVQS